MSPGDEPLRQPGEGQVPEFTDSAWNAYPGVSRIVGLPGAPSVADHGRIRHTGQTRIIPEGLFTTSFPYSITTPSGRKAFTQPPIGGFLLLAGKPVTTHPYLFFHP